MKLRFATVCSGIGAPEVAWTRLGWVPIFSSEIEEFPNTAREHHFPGVPNLGDMTKFREWPEKCTCDHRSERAEKRIKFKLHGIELEYQPNIAIRGK